MNRKGRRGRAADVLGGGGEMGALMRSFDWSASPLGPPEGWPDALKTSVGICLNSRFPMVLWWGPECVMLYNDAWRPVLGATKHPKGLGRPGAESWPEIWGIIGEQMRGVLERGEASCSEDLLLVLERDGYKEEAYFTHAYSPIKHPDGRIGGVFSAVTETTGRVLGERRLRILRELAARTADAKSVEAACATFAEVLGAGNPDVPFAMLYLGAPDHGAVRLLASTGIGAGHVAVAAAIGPRDEDPWRVAEVVRTGAAILLDDLPRRFGDLPGGVSPEPTTAALVLPVARLGQHAETTGALVAGINPRRVLDREYRGFLELVAGQMATAVANARAHEEALRRRPEAPAPAAPDVGVEREILPDQPRLNARLEDLVAERTRALAETNERLRLEKSLSERLVESSLSGIAALDRDYRYTLFNPAMEAMTGLPRSRVLGRVIFEAFPFIADSPAGAAWRRAIERQEASTVTDLRYVVPETRRQGFYEAYYAPLYGSGGECIGALALVRETTERRNVEEQLRQAQRMEAIAQLTGGVAHDFNNLLMIVGGNLELMKQPGISRDRVVGAIERAIARGQGLTRQLLTFSRRQALQPKVIDLSALTPKLIELLRPSLRGDIEVVTKVARDLWPVEVDAGELELAVLNIAVNARDAMPRGGRLTITIRNERLDGEAGGIAGDFVRIAVSDTGTGIPPDILGRVFEPFFTTKEVGKGTGLGLSQVHGFATQSGGTATIASDDRRGTTVTLFLPRSKSPLVPPELEAAAQRPRPASGTILLVEDNEEVAEVTAAMLENLGYAVARAASARRALEHLERGGRADLVLTDIVMPGGTSGIDLARILRERWPGLPVLLTTGYSAAAREAAEEGFILLPKPYQLRALEQLIRTALRKRPQAALG